MKATAKEKRRQANDEFPKLGDDPEVKRARQRLEQLQLQARKLRERKADLERQVGAVGDGEAKERGRAAWEGQPAKAVSKLDATKLTEVTQELDGVVQAIDLAPKIIHEAEAAGSQKLVKNPVVQETYRRTGDRVIAAVVELSRAVWQERAFQERLEEDGVNTFLLGVVYPSTMLPGRLDDHDSQVRYFLRMVTEYGFDIPDLPELDGQKL